MSEEIFLVGLLNSKQGFRALKKARRTGIKKTDNFTFEGGFFFLIIQPVKLAHLRKSGA